MFLLGLPSRSFRIQSFLSIESDFTPKSHADPMSTTKELFMSGLKVEALQREFYNGTRIPDPAPNLSVEQVRELL
jgi:hypothetical protein